MLWKIKEWKRIQKEQQAENDEANIPSFYQKKE
jgi:hypothetical protein